MIRRISLVGLTALSVLVAGCQEDPVDPGQGPLNVEFQTNAGHIHIWETAVTYTASVTAGTPAQPVTNFDTIRVEFAPAGGNTWTRLGNLSPQTGGSYSGTMYWPSQGVFNYRLAGHRPGETGMQVLAAPTTTVNPVRQHADAAADPNLGTWRVEFEPSPGLNEPGDDVKAEFYVMEATPDGTGVRQPIGGLTGLTVTCIDPGATTGTDKPATETAAGRYEAECTVGADGWAKAVLHLDGSGGDPAEVTGEYGVGTISGPPS